MEDILKNAGKSPAKVWQQFILAQQKCSTNASKSASKSAEEGQQKSMKSLAKETSKNALVKISLATGYKKCSSTFAIGNFVSLLLDVFGAFAGLFLDFC